ncbi:MAG: Sec-independent protein translocase protein TatB [Methylotenera sp.]|uniref:Sec-independent protein translocase protein TatB n=1 Tax=Methylotenera sp. TaxID=2051956 RepID=UPI0024870259|nr:Sec-independent protein translocase protein TatB [Methylotenera sp.]MDI1309145.1 Sec-independent protein translocase protein TatB [Methylotenera sp.]
MFDVSFSELIMITVVALIVIGPEKLPKVARTLGALAGRMQRYVAQVKEEVNRDVRFQELQQLQQEIQDTVTKTKETIESNVQENLGSVSQGFSEFKLETDSLSASEAESIDVNSLDIKASMNTKDTKPIVKRTRTKKVPKTE